MNAMAWAVLAWIGMGGALYALFWWLSREKA
ncbi:putative membrane protein [Burkholderia thailandensis Phuket 4W-1]|nr:putative membrane protein [Burkholderia thailandensis Phuket 4W-1]